MIIKKEYYVKEDVFSNRSSWISWGTFCRKLVERGNKVRAFVLPEDSAMKFVSEEAEVVEGDLTDKESLEKLFTVYEDKETIVLHIASIVSVNPDYNQKVIHTVFLATKL